MHIHSWSALLLDFCCSIRQFTLTFHEDLSQDQLFTGEPMYLHSLKSQKPLVLYLLLCSVFFGTLIKLLLSVSFNAWQVMEIFGRPIVVTVLELWKHNVCTVWAKFGDVLGTVASQSLTKWIWLQLACSWLGILILVYSCMSLIAPWCADLAISAPLLQKVSLCCWVRYKVGFYNIWKHCHKLPALFSYFLIVNKCIILRCYVIAMLTGRMMQRIHT